MSTFDVVDASLDDLQSALDAGIVTSVELVALYLQRISIYDCRGILLNSIPVINPNVFEEAADSDDRRAAGVTRGPLDGIPYTVKDSYKVKGMTVANGSPAFKNLVANDDAFTVKALRDAGAVLIGRTNMCPMAGGGMQRGVYGRAESPYNLEYLAAAFCSGSSNGSGVATGASFAAFGLGEETVSSGRSPASNNSLVAYTPSRGYISVRGNWPLYSLCDVVVPHTRTMGDLFGLLDVLSQPDSITKGDFWRHQTAVSLPEPWKDRPASFKSLKSGPSIPKTRIAVPKMYIEATAVDDGVSPFVSKEVESLWHTTKSILQDMGVEIIEVSDFPLVTMYESHILTGSTDSLGLPPGWREIERGQIVALAWEEFLRDNNDSTLKSLHQTEPERVCPFLVEGSDEMIARLAKAMPWLQYKRLLTEAAQQNPPLISPTDAPQLDIALPALEVMRKRLLEDWMAEHGFDFVVFPTNGDVGPADADINQQSNKLAWANGVKYSNGNQVLRHLGVPSINVPMGIMKDKKMPVGLNILGKAYDDLNILRFSYLYEQASKQRVAPFLTPSITQSSITATPSANTKYRPILEISQTTVENVQGTDPQRLQISIQGVIKMNDEHEQGVILPTLQAYIDGQPVSSEKIFLENIAEAQYKFCFEAETLAPPVSDDRTKTEAKIAKDFTMAVVMARSNSQSRPTAWLGLLSQ